MAKLKSHLLFEASLTPSGPVSLHNTMQTSITHATADSSAYLSSTRIGSPQMFAE